MEIKKADVLKFDKIEEVDFLSIKFDVRHHINHAAILYSKIYQY